MDAKKKIRILVYFVNEVSMHYAMETPPIPYLKNKDLILYDQQTLNKNNITVLLFLKQQIILFWYFCWFYFVCFVLNENNL